MQRTYCDKCGKDVTNDRDNVTAHVEFMAPLGSYAFKHLCRPCAQQFVEHLNNFLPGFVDGVTQKVREPKSLLGKWFE
jgi:hypothetical protein